MGLIGFVKSVLKPTDDIFGFYRDEGAELKRIETEKDSLCATVPLHESASFKEGKTRL